MSGADPRPGGARRGRRAWIGLVVAGWLVLGARGGAAADPLTPAERAWLAENGPIQFVSQTDYPPFEFIGKDGQRQGMCLDLIRWMAREIGFEAEFQDMSFLEAQEAVLEGRADVLTSQFYSKERDRRFDFSSMTWEVPALIFVRAERPDIFRATDLAGKRIAMPRGDYAEEFLRTKGVVFTGVPTDSFAEAADRILAGEADAMVGDRPIVLHHLYSHGIAGQMKSVGEPLYIGRNGMAVREGRGELLGILEKGLRSARARGVFEAVSAKWLGTPYGQVASARPGPSLVLRIGLFSALAIAFVLLAWIVHLRRVVVRRTAELREAYDAHKPIARSRPWRLLWVRSLLFLSLLLPLGFAANHLLRQHVIMPGYLALERQEAQKRLNGSMEALRREAEHLGQTAGDWAIWDDTYAFASDWNEAYVAANLYWPGLADQTQIDALLFYDLDGNLKWQGGYDPFGKRPLTLGDLRAEGIPADSVLFRHSGAPKPRTGLLLTDLGPMFVASCPIVPTDQQGAARGILVVGRFLRDSVLADLNSQMGVGVEIADPRTAPLTEKQSAAYSSLDPGATRIEEAGPERLTGYALMGDVEGRPALMLILDIPRDIVGQGRATARLLSFLLFEFILVVLLGTGFWFAYSFWETFRRQAHVEALVDARTRALSDSERKWRSYVKSAPMGIFIVDFAGRCLEANPAACRTTGVAEAELAGRLLGDLQAPECRETFQEHLRQAAEHGHAIGEFRFLLKDGGRRWWSFSTVRLDDHRLLGFSEDITERRREEEDRESLQSQLNQAQKMESIGRLAGGVAHDFNNMLGVILGHAEIAMERTNPAHPVHADLLEIQKAAERSAALTRQLLAFARKQTATPKVLDLNETVDGMLKMLRRLIGEDIDLVWQPKASLWIVKIDPSQIDQILANLCVNARDAIAGVGQITIETSNVTLSPAEADKHLGALPGDYVRLDFRDTGCGMSPETMSHIFEPFFSTKESGVGVGLGLATVYGIVQQNNGFIQVQSELGIGTAFRIHLPRHRGAIQPQQHRDASKPAARGHETILLVEDEPAILKITAQMIEGLGYTVLKANSPAEALRLAKEHAAHIQLLITDVVMPEMNGRDLAKKILSIQPNLKCLFMSGYTADVIARNGVLDKGVHFIEKPFLKHTLAAQIREALDS